MEKHEPVVVVTGASSGIGNACATFLAKRGCRVYGTSRNPSSYAKKADEFFEMIQMNTTDDQSVAKAVGSVLAKEGHIDVLVCNAGMGISGAVEDSAIEDIKLQMDTNFMGAVRCVKAVLPSFRAEKKGKIVIVGSLAGVIGMPFQAFYSSSKYALEGFVESLRYEVRPFGIEACIIEPGDFRTGFTAARKPATAAGESAYKELYAAAMGVQIHDETAGHDPIEVARLVQRLIEGHGLKVRYTVGPAFERAAAIIKRLLPAKAFELFYRKYYKLP
jgi:NAD(P)-dependent dehydrogenase (short-subunit alcohol dehydrogenase family)